MKKLVLLSLCLSMPARAQSPEECAPTDSIDHLRLLRQASLDIRSRAPSYDEIVALRDASDREAALQSAISAMFEQEEYYDQVRRTFQVQLWSSLDAVDLLIASHNRLAYVSSTQMYYQNNSRRKYRGDNQYTCLDQLQTEYDAQGHPVPIQTVADADCRDVGFGEGTCVQEGYELVTPFWDPTIQVKVCAFDAQAMTTGLTGANCDIYNSADRGCGCGPNLRRCMRENETGDIRQALLSALE